MKKLNVGTMLLLLTARVIQGQSLQSGTTTINHLQLPTETAYTVAESGPHHRIWQKATYDIGAGGRITTNFHRYTELTTGLNYQDQRGNWVESCEAIESFAGGAVARRGQHQVVFANDLASTGAIDMQTPDGKRMRSHILGLSYFDTASGKSVFIAEVTNCQGVVINTNQVLYADAFSEFKADVLYTYTKGGFEQDVILRERPPLPENYGLASETTHLQILTEFISPPAPAVHDAIIASGANDREQLLDESLDFGAMKIGAGKAFIVNENASSDLGAIPVAKQWLLLEGRRILVEEVTIPAVAKQLDMLPLPKHASLGGTKRSVQRTAAIRRQLPAAKLAQVVSTNRMLMAKLSVPLKGFVLDYNALNSSLTNYTFQSDTTYYISGAANLYGTNTFEGGTVIKYTNGASINLMSGTPTPAVNWLASAYRPVVFTARDDNTVGEIISGSTGNPVGYYANPALNMSALSSAVGVSNFRIAFAGQAVSLGSNLTLNHGQFVNCQNGITGAGGAASTFVGNVLFANVLTNFNNLQNATFNLQNATFSGSLYLSTMTTPGTVSFAFTNCVLANVTNLYNVAPSVFSAGNGGFFNSPVFGSSQFTNASYPFQAVGGGGYYLTNGCNFFNTGTTNVDTTLLASIRKKTTYPPIFFNSPIGYLSTNLNLAPQAQRDVDAPDLGYHYDPLDYVFGGIFATNSTITVNPGTAIGMYGTNTWQYGLGIGYNSQFSCQGNATNPCWIVGYNTVQEQNPSGWIKPTGGLVPAVWLTGVFQDCRFTDWSVMAQDGPHFQVGGNIAINFRDCQFFGGQLNTSFTTINFVNCFLNRVNAAFSIGDTNTPVLRNNLFNGGTFDFTPLNNNSIIKDNLFDQTSIPDEIGGFGMTYDGGYNAYVTNRDRFQPNFASDIVLSSSPTYQAGPLGGYYYADGFALTNAGSTTANLVGLYHYTTQTNQVKETNSVVDIGYHYVVVDANGVPVDTDGDGIPDYIEDINGNGLADSGESSWTDYYNGSLPNLTIVSGNAQGGMPLTLLQDPLTITVTSTNGLPLTNAPIVFVVTQGGALVCASTNGTFASSVTLQTDTNGQVSVFMLLPSALDASISLTATAWSGINSNQVVFTETTIMGLKVWLRADAGITNSSVNRWSDQTTNHNDATQSTGIKQPLLVTNILNGRPVVRFTAANSTVLNFPNALTGTTGAEVFVVLKAAADLPASALGLWRMGSSGSGSLAYPDASGNIVESFGSATTFSVGNPAQPLDQYHLYNVAGQQGYWAAWINGSVQSSTTNNTYGVWSETVLPLGWNRGAAYFSGDIAEVLIFNRVLSGAERDTVNGYLNSRYAIVSAVPAIPTNLTAMAFSSSQASLTWGCALTNVSTRFQLERKLGAGGTYALVGLVRDGSSFVDTNLTSGTQYYYRIKAINYFGSSGYSTEVGITTLPSGPDLPLGNLKVWLKSDVGVVRQNTNLSMSVWFDQSGNYSDAIQGTLASQPAWVDGALNGRPVVRFNATNGTFLNFPNVLNGTTQAETFVILKAAVDTPGVQRRLWLMGGSGSGSLAYPDASGNIVEDFGSTTTHTVSNPAQPLDQYHLLNVAGQAGYWSAWINGVVQSTTTNNTYGFWTTPKIGGNGGSLWFSGDVAEVLIFNRVLSGTERDSVNGYLNSRYPALLVPSFITQPTNVLKIQGQTATFSVTVGGVSPFGYQWYFNSTPIANATSATLNLTNVQALNAGSYFVVVTNAYGPVTSVTATLTVIVPPTITQQPTNTTVRWGDTATFSVTATGTLSLNYQWYGASYGALLNATNSVLTVSNVQPNTLDNYFVVVTNSGGSVTSAVVTATPKISNYITPSGPLTNFTFFADTTYFINGTVGLYGNTTIEGGTVIKFATNSILNVQGPLICETAPYRTAMLTSKDDNTVGHIISGSTGSPSNANQGTYLSCGSGQTNDYKYLRMAYAGTSISGSGTVIVWHSQFLQCGTAVAASSGGTVRLRNVLVAQGSNCVSTTGTVTGEHLTADQCQAFCPVAYGGANLTNSLLTGVTNQTGVSLFSSQSAASGLGIYQSVGAGNYYLAAGSSNRNGGTTNINASLWADTRQRTTYPPLVLTNALLADTVLVPTAPRDTDLPDLGYHYAAIDYLGFCVVSNATLLVTNGAVFAYPNRAAISLRESGQLISQGTASQRNCFVHYSLVQEQPIPLWGLISLSGSSLVDSFHADTNRNPNLTLRYTSVMGPVGAIYSINASPGNWSVNNVSVRDCEVFAGGANVIAAGSATNSAITFQNSLFYDGRVAVSTLGTASIYNNLFKGATNDFAQFQQLSTNLVMIKDNAFDIGIAYLEGDKRTNAYLNGTTVTSSVQSGDIVTNLTWLVGSLGSFYQPTNSPLINKGSRTADLASLYHFATQTNQVKETNSIVDIGYHYVALTSGVPTDTDGDGVPDYIEDVNGNGNGADDATSWQTYNSPNGVSGTGALQVFTPLK